MNKEEQFNKIYKANKDKIYRICCFYLNDPDDRQDLFQEVLTNVWRGLDRFEGRSKVNTWIYRIAVNTSLAFRIKQRKEDVNMENVKSEFQKNWNPVVSEDHREEIDKLNFAISRLNKIEKAIVSLLLDEVSQQEIAQIMGYSENNIRVRIHRIKQKLKSILKPQAHGYERT